MPEAVTTDNKGKLALDYTMVHTVLLDELIQRVKNIEQELHTLKNIL